MVNGVTRPDRLELLLEARSPRVKVFKLHGDLFLRYMAWTPREMDDFVDEIADSLRPVIAGRDVLVVGHSLRDERIQKLVVGTGGALWYAHPRAVPDHLAGHRALRAVLGPDSKFETLFSRLADGLAVRPAATPGREAPREAAIAAPPPLEGGNLRPGTIDDLMASVVALAREGGPPQGTAFVLAEPWVIVTDPFSGQADGETLDVITSDQRRFRSRILHRDDSHPFGPVLLEVPAGLEAPGLELNPAPLELGAKMEVAVAAGDRVGMSAGVLTSAIEMDLEVAPVGWVEGLVELDFATAPGASGAPVTDTDMAVRGYIVAGGADGEPPSFLYPAHRWAEALKRLPTRRRAASRRPAGSDPHPRSM